MKPNSRHALKTAACLLALACCAGATMAQTAPADAKPADAKTTHAAPSEQGRGPEVLQTFYLKHATQQNDLNDIQTTLRNLYSRAKIYATPSQNAITFRGTAEEVQSAQTLFEALDSPRKYYRLTYTLTDLDSGKRIGVQHFAVVAVAGEKAVLNQGSKVPIVTGDYNPTSPTQNSQVQYLDIGLSIEASVTSIADGINLRTKVNQTSLAEEKSGAAMATGDPVIRQTTFEGASVLVLGKPLVLGSLDTPGSTRHQEIEVVSELIH